MERLTSSVTQRPLCPNPECYAPNEAGFATCAKCGKENPGRPIQIEAAELRIVAHDREEVIRIDVVAFDAGTIRHDELVPMVCKALGQAIQRLRDHKPRKPKEVRKRSRLFKK